MRIFYKHNDKKVFINSDKTSLDKDSFYPEVLIKVIFCGICNSDIKEISGKRFSRSDFGHELLGIIVDKHNCNIEIGAYVILDPHIVVSRGTCFSNLVKITAENESLIEKAILKVPSAEIKYVLTEPLACAIHAVKRLLSVKDIYKNVLVYGAGTFGTLIYQILNYKKINISIGNRSVNRLNYLESTLGVINRYDHCSKINDLYDAIIISQSFISSQEIELLVNSMDKDPYVLLFGAVNVNEANNLYKIRNEEQVTNIRIKEKDITAIGNLGATTEDFQDAIELLQDRTFANFLTKNITKIVTPSEGLCVMNNMVQGQTYFGKIIITFENL